MVRQCVSVPSEIIELNIFETSLTAAVSGSLNLTTRFLSISIRTKTNINQCFFENLLNRFLGERNHWNFAVETDTNFEKSTTHIGDYNLWFVDSFATFW